jgi:hypothetical protein
MDPSDPSAVVIEPKDRLRYRAKYTVVLKAGLEGAGGGTLGQDYESDFSTLDLMGGSVAVANPKDMVVLDHYAIILDRSEGLVTVDLSDPKKPQRLATAPVFTGPFAANQGFALAESFTYVNTTGEAVTAPAIVAVGWISMPQGGVRGLIRIFDATDPVHPRKIGSATIARCTTGVPMKVLVRGQYAVVANLLQGLAVIDLSAVIGEFLQELALAAGEGTFDPGTTLPVAGPIGMSLQEDAANARCEPGKPKAVVGTWDADGELKSPLAVRMYDTSALVGDLFTGVYRVRLDALPLLEGSRVFGGSASRLEVLPEIGILDPGAETVRETDVAAVLGGNSLTLLDVRTGNTLGTSTVTGASYDVVADVRNRLLFVGTSAGMEVFDVAGLSQGVTTPRRVGRNPDVPSTPGGQGQEPGRVARPTANGVAFPEYSHCCVQILIEVDNGQHYRDVVNNDRQTSEDAVLYIKTPVEAGRVGADPQMPALNLRARLTAWADGPPLRRIKDLWVQWEVTLRYAVTIQEWPREPGSHPISATTAQERSHKDEFVWKSERVLFRPAQDMTDPVQIKWEKAEGTQRDPADPTKRKPIPQPSPFVGGGFLSIRANVYENQTNSTPAYTWEAQADDAGLTKIGGQGSGEQLTAYRAYTASMSPGSTTLRVEGQLSYAELAGTATQPAFKVSQDLLRAIAEYLGNPKGVPTNPPRNPSGPTIPTLAAMIRQEVTTDTTNDDLRIRRNLFRLIAFHEGGGSLRHFNDLRSWGKVAQRAGVPKEAVWPILNTSGRRNLEGSPDPDRRHTDGGYGLMQLTNPSPRYEQIWDYRKNIDAAIVLLGDTKLPAVLADVEDLRIACNMTHEQVARAISAEDKRFALYKKYNGEFDESEDRNVPYLEPEEETNGSCKPARAKSDYIVAMRILERRLNRLELPALPQSRWGPAFPGD